jgi:glyoxylase-like metal-dependent hydrolase (beta-lactamase superfamily II)
MKLLLLLLLLVPLGALVWFWRRYLHQTHVALAPGIHAVIGGGGNSLVVEDGGEALLLDTKFPPCDRFLRRWLRRHVHVPIRTVVNTHFHYDHTYGNTLYPGATILAHKRTPELMLDRERTMWDKHRSSMPTELVPDEGTTVRVGETEVALGYPGKAHTHGDLYAHLPQHGIVATGDLLFHGFYPFLDTGPGGAWPPGKSAGLRALARDHPDATFVPGHGPVCRAADLERAADYLDWLWEAVGRARAEGWSVRETRRRLDLRRWGLSPLPVAFRHGRFIWATARSNVAWSHELAGGSP